MSYKPTESKYVGPTKVYYIIYEQSWIHNYRGHRKKRTQTRVKRVYISGTLLSWKKGTFRKRSGRKVYGIQFKYKTTVKGFVAHRGRTRYRQPRKEIVVTKVVELPKDARNVRVSTRAPKGPLMDIT